MMTSRSFVDDVLEMIGGRYGREVGIGLLILVLGYGGWYGYRSYKHKQAEEAQLAFSGAIDEYRQAMQGSGVWENVAIVADVGYRRQATSWAGPYLLALEAYALEQDGKIEESIEIWNRLLGTMSPTNPFWYVFMTKRALVKVQSLQESVHAVGINELRALSEDVKNIYQDQALYFLGFFEKDAWRLLNERFGTTDSPWAALAHN